MALDQPPLNRAQRRAAAHRKQTATLVLPQQGPRPARPQSPRRSRREPPAPVISGGDPSADDEMAETAADTPPTTSPFAPFVSAPGAGGGGDAAPRKASHHKGGGKQQRIYEGLVSYYGFAGMLIATRAPSDGMLIAGEAERLAGLWLDAGKSSPAIMRVLEVITVAGPYTALVFAHGQLALAIMGNHGVSPWSLFAPAGSGNAGAVGTPDARPAPAPLPYQPVGASAPTEAPAPRVSPWATPPSEDEGLRVYPDEGLPSDLDVALRQAAIDTGKPYAQLRDQALLELAQMRMAQNGHVQSPGALGAPVARE